MQTYQITLIRRVIHLLESDGIPPWYTWPIFAVWRIYLCLKKYSPCAQDLLLKGKLLFFVSALLAFIVLVCSQFAVAAFIPSALLTFISALLAFIVYHLLSVCPVGFHLPCPSALSASISALYWLSLFPIYFQFALLTFICPVSLLFRRPFLTYWLSLSPLLSVCPVGFHSVCSVDFHFCPIGFHCFPFALSLPCRLSLALSIYSVSVHFCRIGFSLFSFALSKVFQGMCLTVFLHAFWADNQHHFWELQIFLFHIYAAMLFHEEWFIPDLHWFIPV